SDRSARQLEQLRKISRDVAGDLKLLRLLMSDAGGVDEIQGGLARRSGAEHIDRNAVGPIVGGIGVGVDTANDLTRAVANGVERQQVAVGIPVDVEQHQIVQRPQLGLEATIVERQLVVPVL